MKKDIHPQYNKECKVTCVCGDSMITGSIEKDIKVELCSSCHPFYTGKQKLVDSARRVEKFETKSHLQEKIAQERKGKKVKTAARSAEKAKKEVKVKADSFAKIAQVKLGK